MKCPKCGHEWTPGKVTADEWDEERERLRQFELRLTELVKKKYPYPVAAAKAKREIWPGGGPQLA